MRIALIGTPWYAVPPTGYGGIEQVVALLADGLAARGHDVTLVTAGEHRTRAQTVLTSYLEPQGARIGEALPEVVHAAYVHSVLPTSTSTWCTTTRRPDRCSRRPGAAPRWSPRTTT